MRMTSNLLVPVFSAIVYTHCTVRPGCIETRQIKVCIKFTTWKLFHFMVPDYFDLVLQAR